jgi:ribosomal protein S18 acetylase RimI-like enzyme
MNALRQLRPDEYRTVCSWAIAEQWPGLVKGHPLTYDEFPQILGLPGHFSFALSGEASPAIGFGQVWIAPNGTKNLVRILVDPAMRGKGFGRRLCSLLLAEALRMPYVQQVKLRVRRDNLSAVAVYRSIGFRELAAESNVHILAMAYEA